MESEAKKESRRNSYYFLKSRGICTRCGKEYADLGHTICLDCLEKRRESEAKKFSGLEDAETRHTMQKERYERLKAAGICIKCGKKKAYEHNGIKYVRCYECYIATVNKYQKINQKRYNHYADADLCRWCGGERVPGRIYCEECLSRLQEQAEKNFAPSREKNAEKMKKIIWGR